MEEREQFRALFSVFQEALSERHRIQNEWNDRLKAERAEIFKRAYPRRRKFDIEAIVGNPEHTALMEKYFGADGNGGLNHQLSVDSFSEEKQFKYVLGLLAEKAVVSPGDEWSLYYEVSESDYSSQGWGACKYARDAAQQKADEAEYAGVRAILTEVFHQYRNPIHTQYGGAITGYRAFYVWANLDELDCEILKRKPGVPLREWVRMCWKRGVNPRVYSPFLPEGYEAKVGIDYFGNNMAVAI